MNETQPTREQPHNETGHPWDSIETLSKFMYGGLKAQRAVDDITANYHRGNEHSVAANDSLRLHKSEQLKRVLAALQRRKQAISEDVEIGLGMSHQSCSARFADAKRLGLIEYCGKGKTTSGRTAGMWKLSELGSATLARQTLSDTLRKQ